MKVIILCGGTGTRLEDYSLPKPLNMIHGKPSISYCLQRLPPEVSILHFIVAPHLQKYNFEEIVKNQFKERQCIFHNLPYFTRGPIESAWLGTQDIEADSESIVFLDNDVMYDFPATFFENKSHAFLGYATDTTASEAFSFISIDNNRVINIKEKKRISNNFCCGVYGFQSINQFRDTAYECISSYAQSELYMSMIFNNLLMKNVIIQPIFFPGEIFHIGSLKELQHSWPILQKPSMRICFDLDNTLVTYPTIPGDYSTVKPIVPTINLLRKLKSEGHIIIIHTARRMATHKNNVGAVIKDIGPVTFRTLEEFDIPYDEILFGKPIADIYIDDRAVNPYRDSIKSMGYITFEEPVKPLNALPTNKYNTIELRDSKLTKSGPETFMKGEIYFYRNIPHDSVVAKYFPKYFSSFTEEGRSTLIIENIKSIPFYTLFKSELITEAHILKLFEFIDILHHTPGTIPSVADMKDNYVAKLKYRFSKKEDYPFDDALDVQTQCLKGLESYEPTGAGYIHGDLWFSNILTTYASSIVCIDMKGQVNGILTTGGDIMYDYGKLYQSFLGYDIVLYGDTIHSAYSKKMMDIFLREVQKRGVLLQDLKTVTFSLILGTFHSIQSNDTKLRIWKWAKQQFVHSEC